MNGVFVGIYPILVIVVLAGTILLNIFYGEKHDILLKKLYSLEKNIMNKSAIFLIVVLCVSMFSVLVPKIYVSAATQYQVTFNQINIGGNFTGPVLNVDGVNYTAADLPVTFTWDSSSTHTFTYYSFLTVEDVTQYTWDSTAGLSTAQSGTLTVTGSGSITATYSSGFILDFLNEGKVNSIDFFLWADGFIQYNINNNNYNAAFDLNHDGKINLQDFILFVYYYIEYGQWTLQQ